MKIFIRFIALLILTSTLNFAQWVSQKPEGITSNLMSVHFANETTGWAVGYTSTILKTTDGGTNWTAQTSPEYCDFNAVYSVDENNVFAIGWGGGGKGAIFKTTDGGANWYVHSVDMDDQYMSIYFADSNTGWIVCSGSKILKTTDGGITWGPQSIGIDDLLWFRSVFFIDQYTGWIVGEAGRIFKTTDGGTNWIEQASGWSEYLHSVFFLDYNNGWAVGYNSVVLHTSDGGANWTVQSSGRPISSVYFTDTNNGWGSGVNGKIFKTTNGGTDWEEQETGITSILRSIYMYDSYTGWIVGDNGEIFKATVSPPEENLIWKKEGNELPGGGYSWSTPLIMNNKLFWAGQDKGFAALDAESGNIIWTDTLNFYNGTYDTPVGYEGKIFISRNDYVNHSERSLIALDAETGNVVWQKNNFYTVNRSSKPIGEDGKLYAASNDTLYCFGIDDGNVVWKKAGQYGNLLINYNGEHLYAAKSDSAKIDVLYRQNGTKAWSLTLTDPAVSIASMSYKYFLDKEYLVVAPATRQNASFYCVDITEQSIIWSSDNIGYVGNKAAPVIYEDKVFVGVEKTETAVPQEIVAFSLITGDILWRNQARSEGATNTPFVLALDSKVYYQSSVNNLNAGVAADMTGGNILWNTEPQFQNPWPLVWGSPLIYNNKFYIAKDGEGIFCFDAGTVNGDWTMHGGNIHATNSYFSQFVNVEEDDIEMPLCFALNQNYPNPFNPATSIEYQVSTHQNVTLKVYDILGSEIKTLVSKIHSPGSYKVKFNASELPSGVYFYKLQAGDFIDVKKMILLK